MKTLIALITTLFLVQLPSALACGKHTPSQPLDTVASVDLQRYLGTWYEIARITHSFEENCVGTTATYGLLNDGQIDVLNSCHDVTLDGKARDAHGKAKIADPITHAKLKVTFFWPFYGDYWILELGQNYEYAVVGTQDREYFWILSRTPQISDELLNGIVTRFAAKGFDLSKLYLVPQAQQ